MSIVSFLKKKISIQLNEPACVLGFVQYCSGPTGTRSESLAAGCYSSESVDPWEANCSEYEPLAATAVRT
jgi:hypothetical protein